MKKQALGILSCVLLLSGCSSASATISNNDEKLMTIGSTTYTKGDEYELLKSSNGANMTVELIRQEILNKEIGVDDDIKKAAQEKYNTFEKTTKDLETQIKNAGYKSKEDYIEKVLVPSVQSEKLTEKYFTDGKDEIKKKYKPSVAKILKCQDEKTAKKALEAIKKDTKLEDVYKEYSTESSTYKNEDTLVTTSSTDLPTRLVNTLASEKKTGVIDEVFTADDKNSADKSAYVAILVDNDYDKILDKIKENLSSSSTISKETLVYYLKKYDFKVYDQTIFDYLKSNNPAYLVEYPELAEENQSK